MRKIDPADIRCMKESTDIFQNKCSIKDKLVILTNLEWHEGILFKISMLGKVSL